MVVLITGTGIPVTLTVKSTAKSRRFDLDRGFAVVPVDNGPFSLEVEFSS
jgi:hypothetical protein